MWRRVTGPYAHAARLYRELGWQGVLPCDHPVIGMPPGGYTGGKLKPNWLTYPTDEQVEQWIATLGDVSVGLRLPDDVIVIDVDSYDGKDGDDTLARQETRYGLLPETWTSTSRGPDSTARKRFYRVPQYRENYGWREPGAGLELLHHGHRWARVWPSINHRTGNVERWYRPDGVVSDTPPSPGELALLPDEWIEALWSGEASATTRGQSHAAGGHLNDDGQETFEYRGNPYSIKELFGGPIPPGDQQNLLFSYFSSLRARNQCRTEMINQGMILLQRLVNEPGREPWTAEGIIELIDHVRERSPSGTSFRGTLSASQRDFAASLARGEQPTELPIFTTDMGNTLRLVNLLGDRLRYAVDEERWYVWDGLRWSPDRTNRALDLTKEVIVDIRRSALETEGDERDRLTQWATQSENIARRHAMLAGAEAEPELVITVDRLDVDPHLLVVRNGTLDLTTGQLRESRREDTCSRLAEVTFDPDADCPRWREHVNLLCNGDPALVAYIQRAVGYTLTGDVGARSFFFLEGSGSNGKNAFIEPIMMMLGSYAQSATSALLTGGDEQHPTILADLLGTRLVFIDETRQGKALNVERVKALTGSKRVKARRMRKDFFEFDAQFKLWIAGNGQPTIRDSSDGVWNRMHRVVCHGKVAPAQRIDRFGDKLYEWEASGILNWALAGLAGWRELGSLGQPNSIVEDVQSYRDEEDYVGQFLDDVVTRTGDAADFVSNAALYAEYAVWAARHGLRGPDLLNASHLSRQLVSHGLERHKQVVLGVQTRGFKGVRWTRERVQ